MSIEVGSGGGAFVLGEDEEDSEEEVEEEEEEEDVCQEEKVAVDAVAEDSTRSGDNDSRSSSVRIVAGQQVSSAQATIESNVSSEGKSEEEEEEEEEKEKTSAGGDVEIDLKEKKRILVRKGKKDVSRQNLVHSIGGEEIDLQGLLSRSDVLRKHKRRVKLAVQGLNEWKFACQRDVEQKLSVDTSLKSIHLMVKGALSDMQAARDSMKHAMQLTETTK